MECTEAMDRILTLNVNIKITCIRTYARKKKCYIKVRLLLHFRLVLANVNQSLGALLNT